MNTGMKMRAQCGSCGAHIERDGRLAKNEIRRNRSGKLYCSPVCAGRANGKQAVTVWCAYCWEEFSLKPGLLAARTKRSESGRLFCSKSCSAKQWHADKAIETVA